MNAYHKFHRGYDLSLPIPSARKGYTLPKIGKKKKKKESLFESQVKAPEATRAKSVTRNKKKKKKLLEINQALRGGEEKGHDHKVG